MILKKNIKSPTNKYIVQIDTKQNSIVLYDNTGEKMLDRFCFGDEKWTYIDMVKYIVGRNEKVDYYQLEDFNKWNGELV